MRKWTSLMLLAVAACGGQDGETWQASEDDPSSQAVDTERLAEHDLIRVCRAAASFRGSEPVSKIEGKLAETNMVRLTYTRQSDGKPFAYDCRVDGSQVALRMIDEAGLGTGPGTWSGKGSTITFVLKPEGVEMTESFGPGDSATELVEL